VLTAKGSYRFVPRLSLAAVSLLEVTASRFYPPSASSSARHTKGDSLIHGSKQAGSIVVNGRYRVHQITGVQRYAHEIANRLEARDGEAPGTPLDVLAPVKAKGSLGHLWEQTILPAACQGRLLYSPCASGPAFYSRQVVTFHDIFPIEHPEWYSAMYGAWYRFLMTQLVTRCLHLIAVSEYTKSRLVHLLGCDPGQITVIHNGLTRSCERVGADRVEAARQALKLPTRKYVLGLSSLEKRKNLRTTLEAWARVNESLPSDTWLVLAGSAANVSVYGQQTLPTGVARVFYTGYVPEEYLAGLYSGASLFLFPSLAEGFGLPLLEAMACGLRAITSNTTSLPEVGGDVVTYIDPLDSAALGDKILEAFATGATHETPFLPAIERARRFCWDRAASQTRAVLEAAASFAPNIARSRSATI
jgi:glycosyltransferase involved in cell wall biosynthesis